MSLQVTIGVVRRAVKELEMYRKEVVDGESKLAGLAKDDNFYSQTQSALQESKTMVQQTQTKLKQYAQDLESKLDPASPLNDDAVLLIAQAQQALSSS